jgi:hypothetical protein
LSAAWMSRLGVPCALPPLRRIGTSKTLLPVANLYNPHSCDGSRRDKLKMPNDSKLFANVIKA